MTRDLFRIEEIKGAMVLTPLGDLGDFQYQELSIDGNRLLSHYSDVTDRDDVIVDFRNTVYFGSSTIGLLLRLWKRVGARGGRMILCGLSDDELDILNVVQLDRLWPICSTRDDAIAMLDDG